MGSLAKGETTPFSDLEYMFLIEKKTGDTIEYFERLAVTSYFLIGSLKETKLKYMNIKELKSWFCDESKNGYKIDGLTEGAGNIPTGDGSNQPKNRLIMTVSEAVLHYENFFTMPDEEDAVRGDESAMLSNTSHVYGNQKNSQVEFHHSSRIQLERQQ